MLVYTTTENRTICNKPQTNMQLPRPLNAFSSFPLYIWNELSKNNTKCQDTHMFISTNPHSPYNDNQPLATCLLSNSSTTWGIYNKSWPDITQACLTLFTFIITAFLPSTNLTISSNNALFLQLIKKTLNTPTHRLHSLDKTHYTFILLIIKAISTSFNFTSFTLDKDLKYNFEPEHLFELNIIPQQFLYNRFIPCLLQIPCIYHLRSIIKDNLKIINSLTWANQNRIHKWSYGRGDTQ